MSGIWPNDTRCVVMLGFDVDGVSGAIYQNPDSAHLPSFMSMREYGPSVATPRILDLLDDFKFLDGLVVVLNHIEALTPIES